MKSTCPPMPEKNRDPSESAATWPVRSTASAELIATMSSLREIWNGSFVKLDGRISMPGLSCTHAYISREPMMKDVTAFPGRSFLRRPVTTPDWMRRIAPSDIISVWMPRSLRSARALMTASGMRPMPIWRHAPSGMRLAAWRPICRQTSSGASDESSRSGSSTGMRCAMRSTCRNESPSVRGICGFTSARTSGAVSTAARTMSTETPRLQ